MSKCTDINSGAESTRRLTVFQTEHLPCTERVLVDHFEITGQPVGQAAGLFDRYCLNLGRNYERFPIDALDWRKVSKHLKQHTWNLVKVYFILFYIYIYYIYLEIEIIITILLINLFCTGKVFSP